MYQSHWAIHRMDIDWAEGLTGSAVPKRRMLSVLVVMSAGGLAVTLLPVSSSPPERVPMASTALKVGVGGASAQRRLPQLPVREALGKPHGELFAAPQPEEAPRTERAASVAVRPVPPPVPYRIAGQLVHAGVAHVVLAREDRVHTVRVGEIFDDDYRLEAVRVDGVTLIYVPLNARQHLPVTGVMSLDATDPTAALAPLRGTTAIQ